MKKFLALVTALTMVLALAACGNDTSSDKNKGDGSYVPKTIYIDDVEYTLPLKLDNFINNGWSISESDSEITTVSSTKSIDIQKDNATISVRLYNPSETSVPINDSTVYGISILSILGGKVNIRLSNGISTDDKLEKIEKLYKKVKDNLSIKDYPGGIDTTCAEYTDDNSNHIQYICYQKSKKLLGVSVEINEILK